MTPDVEEAIEEVRSDFEGHGLRCLETEAGGAWVIVEDIELGDGYAPASSWIGFGIADQYPFAQVYPHYLQQDLRHADGSELSPPFQTHNQRMPGFDLAAVMLSRTSRKWNPASDTASIKLRRVIDWIRTHA